MGRRSENTGFICEYCGRAVVPIERGSYRNHCPYCLYSKHVDNAPGDRESVCRGMMKPIGLRYHTAKGYQVIHRCLRCGAIKVNRVVGTGVQPDSIDALVELGK